ncbi:uncharacterized protein LOC121256919 [Juglans microcarpa x Juglans regia]|uniref:uncharacterized protein LOC121256919 n=1 Tax=Juglans microcarpa x Juglans regia TaxID=2249226 RepID=UPI001B7E426D|nr:uncharacterized protein LOC121256919 [Juglans microcarpa x Juglans regia]
MDNAAAVTGFRAVSFLASYSAGRMTNSTNLIQSPWPSAQAQTLVLRSSGTSWCRNSPSHRRGPCSNSRNSSLFLTQCSSKPSIDSNSATNKNPAIELDSNSKSQSLATPTPNQALTSTCSNGLVLDLGPKNSWDSAEIGSPVVKRFIGDNEERWYMWYHGRSDAENTSDSVGLAVSSNGIHWSRGADHVRSCGDVGLVMNCSHNWWAFDTKGIRPSEMVIMSSPMYSAVYWLYYTGYGSEDVNLSGDPNGTLQNPERVHSRDEKDDCHSIGKMIKSLPGLACSQDGRHWARIEGDDHSGALFDVGSDKEWDSLFIAAPQVVVHSNDDLRMYYHSFDAEKGQFAIGIARSRDGIRWVKLGKIMGGGSSSSFDELGVKNACVVRNRKNGNYLMAYEGISANGERSIGLAVSPDGLKNWERFQEDPIIKPSEKDGWDNKGVGSPCLIQMEDNADKWRLYYAGVGHGGKTGIGLAVSEGSNVRNFRRRVGSHQL